MAPLRTTGVTPLSGLRLPGPWTLENRQWTGFGAWRRGVVHEGRKGGGEWAGEVGVGKEKSADDRLPGEGGAEVDDV